MMNRPGFPDGLMFPGLVESACLILECFGRVGQWHRDWHRWFDIRGRTQVRNIGIIGRIPSVAEANGNRTRQGPNRPLTGFEDSGAAALTRPWPWIVVAERMAGRHKT